MTRSRADAAPVEQVSRTRAGEGSPPGPAYSRGNVSAATSAAAICDRNSGKFDNPNARQLSRDVRPERRVRLERAGVSPPFEGFRVRVSFRAKKSRAIVTSAGCSTRKHSR